MSSIPNATSNPNGNSNPVGNNGGCKFSPFKLYHDMLQQSAKTIVDSCFKTCSELKDWEIARCEKQLQNDPSEKAAERFRQCVKKHNDLNPCMQWCFKEKAYSMRN